MNPKKIELPEQADFSYIKDIAGGDQSAYENLLRIIGKNLNEYPPQIAEAHNKGTLEDMKKLAHKYKSCTAYLNFPMLDTLLNDLEYGNIEERSPQEREEVIDQISQLSEFLEKEVVRALG